VDRTVEDRMGFLHRSGTPHLYGSSWKAGIKAGCIGGTA
jgi:hypothetical protein